MINQIMTLLPADEDAFEKDKPTVTPSLEQVFSGDAIGTISPFAGVVVSVGLLGRILVHLHRPTTNGNEADINGAFWRRHRELDSTVSTICLGLPDRLRVTAASPDTKTVFLNMLLQTSVICLHQAAIWKAEANKLPASVSMDSRARCMDGAGEIGRSARMLSNIDLSSVSKPSKYGRSLNWYNADHGLGADESIPRFLSLHRR